MDGSLFSGFIGDGLAGLLNVYPQYNSMIKYCDKTVQDAVKFHRTQGNCIIQAVTTYNFEHFADRCHFENYTFYNYPPILEIMGKETLLMNESTKQVNVPKFPRLMWHSVGDEIVPFAPAQQYVDEQCAHGANLQFAALGVGEHVSPLVYLPSVGVEADCVCCLFCIDYRRDCWCSWWVEIRSGSD